MVDTLSKFGNQFQVKVIAALLTDRTFIDQIQDIIDSKYFESDAHIWIVDTILWYFSTYKDLPTDSVFKKELKKLRTTDETLRVVALPALNEIYHTKESTDLKYVKDEFLTFCRNQALRNAILIAADQLQVGDYDSIKTTIDKAMHAGQERNYGHDWKKDVESRLTHNTRFTISTGWDLIDNLLDGGLGAGELGVVVGPSGAGKSSLLSSIGRGALMAGHNVLHYTLELNDDYTGLRYDSGFTKLESRELKHNIELVKATVEKVPGNLYIKYYPTNSVTITTLMAHIQKLKSIDFHPNMIIVDYADLLRNVGRSNARYEELGAIYADLRGLAGELNLPIWTGSQSQRSSTNDEIIEGNKIAESYNKIMISDFVLSISRKTADKLTDTARIHIIKNRLGPDGMTFPAHVDLALCNIEIYDEDSPNGQHVRSRMESGETAVKNALRTKLKEFNDSKSIQ